MDDKSGWFDGEAFYEALDAARQAQKMTWKQVASADKNLSPEAATALNELIKATYERLRTDD